MMNRMRDDDHNVIRSKGMMLKKKLMRGKNLLGQCAYQPTSTRTTIWPTKNGKRTDIANHDDLSSLVGQEEHDWDFGPPERYGRIKSKIRPKEYAKSEIDYSFDTSNATWLRDRCNSTIDNDKSTRHEFDTGTPERYSKLACQCLECISDKLSESQEKVIKIALF